MTEQRLEEIKEKLVRAAPFSEGKGAYADMWWMLDRLTKLEKVVEVTRVLMSSKLKFYGDFFGPQPATAESAEIIQNVQSALAALDDPMGKE